MTDAILQVDVRLEKMWINEKGCENASGHASSPFVTLFSFRLVPQSYSMRFYVHNAQSRLGLTNTISFSTLFYLSPKWFMARHA
ncbi:uncharacterized protein C8R40DRAFT_173001 [Lentinula edodes]|uniref:uncharacterized protein n=1 Tax=Lentinula edodes TaxID=5353 RepID=UPI001E8EA50C|nr:uncharacterized protein C8R40DRAFT_173001 [Lentinula edodes]KAH7875969.1 hypothetical protein C8R40DRAFT_173001 [Lentinula edodes]